MMNIQAHVPQMHIPSAAGGLNFVGNMANKAKDAASATVLGTVVTKKLNDVSISTREAHNATNEAMGKFRSYMGTDAAGVTATASWQRLGGSGGKDEVRPPFEFAITLKHPSKSIFSLDNAARGIKNAKDKAQLEMSKKLSDAKAQRLRRKNSSSIHATATSTSPPASPSEGASTSEIASASTASTSQEFEAEAEQDSNNNSEYNLCPSHEAIVNALFEKGLQVMVIENIYHHGKRQTMLLLNAPESLIDEQVYLMKLMRWIRTGGIGDMPDKEKKVSHTPSVRILAIENALQETMYVDPLATGAKGRKPKVVIESNLILENFPLHDHTANDFLLTKLNAGGSLQEKLKSTFLSDEVLDAIRNHFGDRTGFYYAYFSFYTR